MFVAETGKMLKIFAKYFIEFQLKYYYHSKRMKQQEIDFIKKKKKVIFFVLIFMTITVSSTFFIGRGSKVHIFLYILEQNNSSSIAFYTVWLIYFFARTFYCYFMFVINIIYIGMISYLQIQILTICDNLMNINRSKLDFQICRNELFQKKIRKILIKNIKHHQLLLG